MRAARLVVITVCIAAAIGACTETPGSMFYDIVEENAGSGGQAGGAASSGGAPGGGSAGQAGARSAVEAGAGGVTTPEGGSGPEEPNPSGGRQPTAGTGSTAGSGAMGPRPLAVCARQRDLTVSVESVRIPYRNAVARDCRVADMLWRAVNDDMLDPYADQLARYSAWLWGCAGAQKELPFGIAYRPEAITQGDADVLIAHYVMAATGGLELTAAEAVQLRELLEFDAAKVVEDPSTTEFTYSNCVPQPVGEGGAGGAGGAAGAAGSSTADAGQSTGGSAG